MVRGSQFMGGGVRLSIGRHGRILSPDEAKIVPARDKKRGEAPCSRILSHETAEGKSRGQFVHPAWDPLMCGLMGGSRRGCFFRDCDRQRVSVQVGLQGLVGEIAAEPQAQLVIGLRPVQRRNPVPLVRGAVARRSDRQIGGIDLKIDPGRIGARNMHDQLYRILFLMKMIARSVEYRTYGIGVAMRRGRSIRSLDERSSSDRAGLH